MISRRSLVIIAILAASLALAGCSSSKAPGVGAAGATQVVAPPSGNAQGRLSAADAALDRNDLVAAENEYKAAATLDPRAAAAQFGLGNVYVRQNRFGEAESAYQAALALDGSLNSARANLGVVYYQMGQLSKAADQFTIVLKGDPTDAQTTYLLAAVRLQESNLPEAEKLLIKARDLKPNLPEVYYGLGVLYKFKGQNTDAITAFEKFLSIGPGQDPSAMDYARSELKTLKGQ